MKQFLISAVLAGTAIFTSCSGGSSNNTSATSTDTATTATANSTTDENQQKLEANKKLVTDFYQSLYGDKDSTAIDKYVADNIIEHNPLLQDGKEWLKNSLRPFLAN